MRRALGVGICMLALTGCSSKALIRATPGGGYSCDTTGLSYAFAQSDPDFRVVEGYAVLKEDLELLGAIIGLENGTVIPAKEGDNMRFVGPIEYQYGSAESILMKADRDKDFAVNTGELNFVLYRTMKRLYPGLVQ